MLLAAYLNSTSKTQTLNSYQYDVIAFNVKLAIVLTVLSVCMADENEQ